MSKKKFVFLLNKEYIIIKEFANKYI